MRPGGVYFEADSTAILWMRIVGAERCLRSCGASDVVSPVSPLAFFGELGIPSGISGETYKPLLSNPL
ncbi:MAG: hypothetical protein USCAAHI_01348 [Beijerinckiaceae bacterium]|nr:MAG: hypothetical protein USCAAHI_01348 [Beijerinckiaceae bacterium]